MPLIAFFLLHQSIHSKNKHSKIKHYFLILYQGLKPSTFYWEFINSLRKVLILMAFLLPASYKIVASASVLIIIWRIQYNLKPYKNDNFNDVEILGINAAIITLLAGMVFSQQQKDISVPLNMLVLFVIFILNFIFLLKWIILLCENLGEKYQIFSKVKFL